MSTFSAFFFLELKRLLVWRKLLPASAFLLFSIYLVIMGIQQYGDMKKGKEKFRELERKKVEQIVNWDQYGLYGFRLYFMPGPISTLFFNSSHFTELTCHIDSGEKLTIYGLFKGKKIFEEKPGKLMDFSGIILILGSFITLFYGFDAFRHKEYIKFLASLYGHGKTFFFIWLSRVILLCIYFVFVTLAATLWLVINHIQIKGSALVHLSVFFLVILMMQVFFFTMGTTASRLKSRMMAGILIAFSWILSVYIIPAALNKIVEAKARDIQPQPIYKWELDKLKILMGFERKVIERITEAEAEEVEKQHQMVNALYSGISKKGIQTPADFWKWIDSEKRREKITQRELDILEEIEDQREKNLPIEELRKLTVRILRRLYETLPSQIKAGMARRYLEEEYLEIQNIEKDLLKQMRSDVNFFQGLFSIFPTTFYLSTGNEISSRGYANIIRFYEEAIGTKKDFMTFYVGHRYGDNPDRIVNFIEEREKGEKEANIFKATCQLPGKFGLGMGFTLLWIFAALFFSYLSYKKALFPLPKEEITGLSDLELELEKGISNVVVSKGEAVCDHLYNVLSGKNKSFSGAVIRDKVHLETEKTKVDFVYLCQPEKIPGDIKVGHFIRFFRKTFRLSMAQLKEISTNKFKLNLEKMHGDTLGDLDEEAKGIILLEIARVRKRDVYMLYNYTRGMGSDCRREIIEQLKKLKQEEASILYITNDLLLAQEIGDYVSILKKEF